MHVLLMRESIVLVSVLLLFLGSVTLAQVQGDADLSATVRKVILSDPRSSEMTETQINAMITALAAQAEAQGMTSEDITWRPQDPATFADADERSGKACGYPAFLCAMNDAFGFNGSAALIPLLLGVSSALLLFIIGSILLHTHGHHPVIGSLRREG